MSHSAHSSESELTPHIHSFEFNGAPARIITYPMVTLGLSYEEQNYLRCLINNAVQNSALSFYQKNNVWRFINDHHNDLFAYIQAPAGFTRHMPHLEHHYTIELHSDQDSFSPVQFIFTPIPQLDHPKLDALKA